MNQERRSFALLRSCNNVARKTCAALLILTLHSAICLQVANAQTNNNQTRDGNEKPSVSIEQQMQHLLDTAGDAIIAQPVNVPYSPEAIPLTPNASNTSRPFYKMDVIAESGTQGLTDIFPATSVNSKGEVVFIGKTAAGTALYIGDKASSSRPYSPILPNVDGTYSGAVQITDNGKAVATQFLTADAITQIIVSKGGDIFNNTLVVRAPSDPFTVIDQNPTVNIFEQPVFAGNKNGQKGYFSGYRPSFVTLKLLTSTGNNTVQRPMIADNGRISAREYDNDGVYKIRNYLYGVSTDTGAIIESGNRFNEFGASPGITDDGQMTVFYGDLKADSGSNWNTFYGNVSGKGIFAAVTKDNGVREVIRLTGKQSEKTSLAPLLNPDPNTPTGYNGKCEQFESASNCLKDELGYDGIGGSNSSGNPIHFSSYDNLVRVGVAHIQSGAVGLDGDSFITSFVATPSAASPAGLFSNQNGLWTVRTDIKLKPIPSDAYNLEYTISPAKPVIQINDTINGSAIQSYGVYDPISRATTDYENVARVPGHNDHRIVFWAQNAAGKKIVVRATYLDTDDDGLPDDWENNGVTFNGTFVDLKSMGSKFNHKDLFVQANWLTQNGNIVFKPQKDAMKLVIEAYKNSPVTNPDNTTGINLHIDAGPDIVMNPQTSEKWNALSRASSFAYTPNFGANYPYPKSDYNWGTFDASKRDLPSGQTKSFFGNGRAAIFRYALFVETASPGAGGKARSVPATDFIVSLGGNRTPITMDQAGTFMHELGHTLGLQHGGNDDVNDKPNYLSVMNYFFQSTGLRNGNGTFQLDYSRRALPNLGTGVPSQLNENTLNENVGISDPDGHRTQWFALTPMSTCDIKTSSGIAIDWNNNMMPTDNNVSVNINGDGNSPTTINPNQNCQVNSTPRLPASVNGDTILKGFEDWSVLKYDANGAVGAGAAGAIGSPPVNLISEQTLDQVISLIPPDIRARQVCDPNADVNITVSGTQIPVSVTFNASASTAPCGNIVSYNWTFGDGTTGTGAQPTHVYANPGIYTASLSLTDNNGNTSFIPTQYQITATANYSLSGRVTDAGGNGLTGVTVNLTGGQTTSVLTNSTGNYTFSNVASGDAYTVAPTKDGYRFSAGNRVFTNLNGSKIANFRGVASDAPSNTKNADFDGDGRSDISTFRPSNTTWYVQSSLSGDTSATVWGLNTDKIAPGDYDGDGKADIAVFRPSNGSWYVLKSGTNTLFSLQWGISGDIPVAGDYDSDGLIDVAVWRPSTGSWYVLKTSGGSSSVIYGQNGDTPMVGDFDGDGKTDYAFFRPSNTNWYIQKSSGGTVQKQFGFATDKLVPADYDGDGKAEFAVWRPSAGYWITAPITEPNPAQNFTSSIFGTSGDIPVPGDYDGDGRYDRAVFRGGQWYIQDLPNNAVSYKTFGLGTDQPILNAYLPQ